MTTLPIIANSAIFAFLGIAILMISFIIVDVLTPGKLWGEIFEQKNQALATLAGAGILGISIIIAAAIHG